MSDAEDFDMAIVAAMTEPISMSTSEIGGYSSGTITGSWSTAATTSTRITLPGTTSGTTISPSHMRITGVKMKMPTRMPAKILIAFLDQDDTVEWCAKLPPGSVDISMDGHSYSTMQLELPLYEVE